MRNRQLAEEVRIKGDKKKREEAQKQGQRERDGVCVDLIKQLIVE